MRAAVSTPRRCLVCNRDLAWPALCFCGPAYSEAWVRRHRADDRELPAASRIHRGSQGSHQ